jgi:hypothetical protein
MNSPARSGRAGRRATSTPPPMQTFAVSSLLAFFYGAIGATSTASWLANRRESGAAARIAHAMFPADAITPVLPRALRAVIGPLGG